MPNHIGDRLEQRAKQYKSLRGQKVANIGDVAKGVQQFNPSNSRENFTNVFIKDGKIYATNTVTSNKPNSVYPPHPMWTGLSANLHNVDGIIGAHNHPSCKRERTSFSNADMGLFGKRCTALGGQILGRYSVKSAGRQVCVRVTRDDPGLAASTRYERYDVL